MFFFIYYVTQLYNFLIYTVVDEVPESHHKTDILPEKDFGKSWSPLLQCYLSKNLSVSEFYYQYQKSFSGIICT